MWTGLFALPIGLLFAFMGLAFSARTEGGARLDHWPEWLGVNLFIALFISFFIHGLIELLARLIGLKRLRAWSEGQRGLFFTVVPIAGVLIGWPIAVSLLGLKFTWFRSALTSNNANAGALLFMLMFSALMYFYFDGKARTEAAERRAAEARLRLLQGQIEPHFLFNTLANVQGLIDVEPQRASRMLAAFTDYLRSSFGGLRAAQHTVGQELALVEAYLAVLSLRMEDRLTTVIDVPADLQALPLPPLVLQPLVENAITHGLEPQVEGGTVRIRAGRDGASLWLEVCDDGQGLDARPATAGQGSAVANIRERLQHQFGDAAALTLEALTPHGTKARLSLPLDD